MSHLTPVPQPIALFPAFIATQPETLVLKEKVLSLSGDSFSIKLANGTPILQVEGKVMSISGRKKVRNMAGEDLFSIVKKHFHIHSTYVVESATGEALCEVKSAFKLVGSKATATFTSHMGQPQTLTMNGNWFDTTADITDSTQGGAVVARIDRKMLSGKDLFFGQQTYGVQVAPGVDLALITALCICLDEKNNEK
ncbi:tubby C-terminal-like domain-containing protein [Phaeosphaeriaceae sp. PMI808]|nr:tubby C-terminal-like domain-containing protein [Phaeosphaeriaceae sp. PMI808]